MLLEGADGYAGFAKSLRHLSGELGGAGGVAVHAWGVRV